MRIRDRSTEESARFSTETKWWEEVRALPTLPSVLFRFLGLVGDRQTSNETLAEFICQDPALLARVLPVLPAAPAPGQNEGVMCERTLHQAVASLGRERIRALAHTTPLLRTFEPGDSGSYATTLWERSLLCAHAAEAAARYLKLDRPERFYAAGLLHDLGYLVVLQKRPALFTLVLQRWAQRPAALLEIETEIFGIDHCELGLKVAQQLSLESWILPGIANHHCPALDAGFVSRITCLAAAFCNWQGKDLFPRRSLSRLYMKSRAAQTREMHEILRGLLPELNEIDRHRVLHTMADTIQPANSRFLETFAEWFAAGESWIHPYRFIRQSEAIAAVA